MSDVESQQREGSESGLVRLGEFILGNMESILADWVEFARSTEAGGKMEVSALRDHAEGILRASVADMKIVQTDAQQEGKSKGAQQPGGGSERLEDASQEHAIERLNSGFPLREVVAEYRALRASVIRLWGRVKDAYDAKDIDDLTRFNESIDQSLTRSVSGYTERVEGSRQMFLAILSHDLRNPLGAISMSAQVLTRMADLKPTHAALVSGISRSSAAMTRMISDLLDFTSTGLGSRMPLSTEPMDLTELCDSVINEVRHAHPSRTLDFEHDGDLVGQWDSGRLRQLLSNLIGNAVQHGAPERTIVVSAVGSGVEIVLAVRNSGNPIPPDALGAIFDPLVRGVSEEVQKNRRPGSIGLGLYIAREVARAHGGDLTVTSSAADGTTFIVRLPRATAVDRSNR